MLDAGLRVLARHGYDGLAMRGVARELGASLATVQRHFATKDELWRGCVDQFLDGIDEDQLWSSGDPLQTGIELLLGRSAAHPGLVVAILCDQSPGHLERFDHITHRLAELHRTSSALMADLRASGAIAAVDTNALLLLMRFGIGAIASAPSVTKHIYGFDLEMASERQRLASALADIVRNGLAAR